jgi:hypothetical protein
MSAKEMNRIKKMGKDAGMTQRMFSAFFGINIKDKEKVRVTFEEAKNADGEDFSTSHAEPTRRFIM